MPILHPQECFLLERYTSLDYFHQCYKAWYEFVAHCESCYQRYMGKLPVNYRSLPIWQQADMVWGNRILPNIRSTMNARLEGYLLRQHDDVKAFTKMGGGSRGTARGIKDHDSSWMSQEDLTKMYDLLRVAENLDEKIGFSITGGWKYGRLTFNYREKYLGPLTLPERLPVYKQLTDKYFHTGDKVEKRGLYISNVDNCPVKFIIEDVNFGKARQYSGLEESIYEGEVYNSWETFIDIPCNWVLVQRVEGQWIDVPKEGFFPTGSHSELIQWANTPHASEPDGVRIKVLSGSTCPYSGQWATFMEGSLHYQQMKQGERVAEYINSNDKPTQVYWTLLKRDDSGSIYL